MKSKDKKKRIVRITLKNIIAFCVFNISILYIVIFYNFYFSRNDVYAKETSSKIENIKNSKEFEFYQNYAKYVVPKLEKLESE